MSREARATAAYRLLLRTLPRRFRERHAAEMEAWFREHHRATRTDALGRAGLWPLILEDYLRTMLAAWSRVAATRIRTNPPTGGRSGMDGLTLDMRMAIRSFRNRPGVLALILATLALGVGSATTVYSVVHGVLLAPLPYDEPDRVVRVGKISEGRAGVLSVSAPDLVDLQERNRSFRALAASRPANLTLSGQGDPELVRAAIVSAEFFDVLGRYPALGRAWAPAADEPDAPPVAVLGHGAWQRRWGGDPDVLGHSVVLNGASFTVVGVLPSGFVPPEALGQSGTEVWIPLSSLDPGARSQRRNAFLQLIGRLRPEVAVETAREELAALGATISRDHPEPGERTFGLAGLHAETVGDAGATMMPVLASVAMLLAIACINVANLLLMRATERSREMTLRSCLGAGRARIFRQLMTESLFLGLAGGLLGALVAAAGVKAFAHFGPTEIPRLAELSVSGMILLYAVVIAGGTSVLLSVVPAIRASRDDLEGRLRGGHRGTSGRAEARVRDAFVIVEAAMSIVLVICGGLLFNSLLRVIAVDPGFEPEGVAVVSVLYPDADSDDEITAFFDDVIARIGALPGVRAVGATVNLPLSGNDRMLRLNSSGLELEADDVERGGLPVAYQQVTADYFETMGIATRRGRAFASTDDASAPRVAIVNEALARRLASDGGAIGRRLTLSDDPDGERPLEIVGVVADTRQHRLTTPGEPELYLPFHQLVTRRMEIVARGSTAAPELLPSMRQQLRSVRPDLPIRRSVDMTSFVAQTMRDRRFLALLVGGFALLALTLTVVGVYGTLAYSVMQRRRELGVRLALGATGTGILRTVLLRSTRTVAIGIMLGVGAATLATRLLDSLLYDVSSMDPVTIAFAVAIVLGAATAASLVPARKASRVDPMTSLRVE